MTCIPSAPLGSSGISIARIGLGCNRIGEEHLSDSEWVALLHEAADLGVTLFDTAAAYAGGRSEELVGQAFKGRSDVVIATKVSPVHRDGKPPFTAEVIIRGAERSLRALQRECIDVLQTHGSGSLAEMRDPEWAEAMGRLQEQGKIRLRAAAVFHAVGAIHAVEQGLVDVLQVTYNLIDRSHAEPILPVAASHGVGLIARMPFQRGTLTGKFSPGAPVPEGHRARLQGEQLAADIEYAERFRSLGQARPGGMTALAIQYVLAERRMACTIPGARSREQLRLNLEAARAPALTDDERRAVETAQQA
ncbi:MAG: hypothetical protein GF331_20620 [Chitinivibrionales bacterium]|nr:hypothetical protein [Chitinivibrionales bacterium]